MKKQWIFTGIRFVLFLTPFVIGTLGFLPLSDGNLINAMYSAMRLYIIELDCDPSQITPMIEVARWLSPLMTVAALFTMLSAFFSRMRDRIKIWSGDAVAIHGDSKYVEMLRDKLGKKAIMGDGMVSMQAQKQVLIFNEDKDMFTYLDEHRNQLLNDEKKVYLCSERIVRGSYVNQNLILCNFAENCARQYWKDHPLRMEPEEKHVVIIGFNSYGQEILTQALLMNVYRIDSRIQYHVFGPSKEYLKMHTQLHQVLAVNPEGEVESDCVYFHEEPWYEDAAILESADRIILVDDSEEKNLLNLNSLNKYYVTGPIYIKVTNRKIMEGLWDAGDGHVISFGTEEGLCTPEVILDEATLDDAKRIHSKYFRAHQCPKRKKDDGPKTAGEASGESSTAGTCEKPESECYRCPELLKDWNELNSFTRYSNVAQADHIPVKIHILLGDGYKEIPDAGAAAKARYDAMTDEEKLVLYEIEHIRWDRYHYMNNWTYAPVRDKVKKKHHLLIPFADLSWEEKVKDADTWDAAFELYRGDKN